MKRSSLSSSIFNTYSGEFAGLLWKKAMTMASRWICESVTKKHSQAQWNEEDKKPICLFIQSRTYCTPHQPDLSAFTKWPVQSHLLTASMTAFIILDQAKNIHWAHLLQCCKSCTCDLKTLRHKNIWRDWKTGRAYLSSKEPNEMWDCKISRIITLASAVIQWAVKPWADIK